MPPLEAFELGTPVIVSDLEGIRDQVSDAALLVPPDDPAILCDTIIKLLKDENLRNNLIRKGKKKLSTLTDNDRLGTLNKIFNAYYKKSSTWSLD